ncbi:unnamed protein product [Closterium sp. NIES-54]
MVSLQATSPTRLASYFSNPPCTSAIHISSPHPVLSSPHPVLSSPHPVLSSPHPVLSSPHPVLSSPHPVLSSPHPVLSSPHPVLSSPHPVLSSPHPVLSSPHPVLSSPHPVLSSPHPVLSCPHPVLSSPHPFLSPTAHFYLPARPSPTPPATSLAPLLFPSPPILSPYSLTPAPSFFACSTFRFIPNLPTTSVTLISDHLRYSHLRPPPLLSSPTTSVTLISDHLRYSHLRPPPLLSSPSISFQRHLLHLPLDLLYLRMYLHQLGWLQFYSKETLELVRVTGVSPDQSVVRVLWHAHLNQIFATCGDKKVGSTHILYEPTLSERGALVCVARAPHAPRPKDLCARVAAPAIRNPHALPMFCDEPSRKRQREKARKVPVASQRPDLPMEGPGHGGRVGHTKGTLLIQYLLRVRAAACHLPACCFLLPRQLTVAKQSESKHRESTLGG